MLRHASDAATFRSILFGRSAGVSQRWVGVGTAGEFNVRVGDEEWPVSEARPQTDKRKRRPATVLDSIRPHRGGRQLPARRPVPANDSASSKPRPCSACQSLSKRTRPAAACPMHPAAVSGGCCSQPESRVCAAASWSSRSSDRGRPSHSTTWLSRRPHIVRRPRYWRARTRAFQRSASSGRPNGTCTSRSGILPSGTLCVSPQTEADFPVAPLRRR